MAILTAWQPGQNMGFTNLKSSQLQENLTLMRRLYKRIIGRKAAMSDELLALMGNPTRSQVPLQAGRKTIGRKGVFEVKEKPD